MPDRVVAQLTCESCEGTGAVTEFRTPDGERYVVPCPVSKLKERVPQVMKALGSPATADLRASMRRKLLMFKVQAFLEHASYDAIECEDCSGRGWTLRLVQADAEVVTRDA